MLLVVGYLSFEVYKDPGSIKGVADVGSQSLDDIVKWGRLKIGADTDPNSKRKKYNSFAEEMLLGGIDDDDQDDENEGGEQPTAQAENTESQEESNSGSQGSSTGDL